MDVLKKARELAMSILESDEYLQLKKAEEEFNNDLEAPSLIKDYEEHLREYNLRFSKQSDKNEIESSLLKLKKLKNKIDNNKVLNNLYQCQKKYDSMMKNVNNIVDFIIGKESKGKKCNGCSGCK